MKYVRIHRRAESTGTKGVNPSGKLTRRQVDIDKGIARCLLPKIQKYYESDEGKADLEKYRAEKENVK